MLIIYLDTKLIFSCDLDENTIERNIFILILYFVNIFLSKKKIIIHLIL